MKWLRGTGVASVLCLFLTAVPAQAQRELLPVPELARPLAPVRSPELRSTESNRSPELNRQFHRAETAWRSGTSLLEAKARVDRVLKELPGDTEARKLRAQVLLGMGQPEAALVDARRAIELGARTGEVYLVLCEAARLSGDQELAEQALDTASNLVLEDAAQHIQFSWNAVELGRLDQAEAFARVARALAPDNPMAYYQLARVFVLKDRLDDAASVLASGIETAAANPLVVEGDPVLRRLAGHQALKSYLAR